MCYVNGVGQKTLENAEVFLAFLALVGLLPAGDVNFLILVACINLYVLINVIRIKWPPSSPH